MTCYFGFAILKFEEDIDGGEKFKAVSCKGNF